MRIVGAYEAKTRLAELLDGAERGDSVTIARHGRPVARLVPMEPAGGVARDDAIEAVREFAATHRLDGLDIRILVAEGRR